MFDIDPFPVVGTERHAIRRRAVDAIGIDAIEQWRSPVAERLRVGDRVAGGRSLDVGRDHPDVAEPAGDLGEGPDAGTVDTIVVGDEDPHAHSVAGSADRRRVPDGGRTMRLTLVHNPKAGDSAIAKKDLLAILERAGYQISYYSTKDQKKRTKISDQTADGEADDLVVAAGGDGTARDVILDAAGSPIPVAIVPLGMANNIAKALGIHGEIQAIAEGWKDARPQPFDLGLVADPGAGDRFVESFGGGIFASLIEGGETQVQESPSVVGRETDRAVYLMREITRGATLEDWGVTIDGQDASGRYIGVQVQNIRFGGPNIPLAADADPGDGQLDVVLFGPAEREALIRYLTGRLEHGAAQPLELPARRAREITLRPPSGATLHLDDEIWREAGQPPAEVTLRVEPDVVRVLPPLHNGDHPARPQD
jgi:diacylglycerol kinase (ATP)